jgi:hypothetical protein
LVGGVENPRKKQKKSGGVNPLWICAAGQYIYVV